jgi:hypothetical protein
VFADCVFCHRRPRALLGIGISVAKSDTKVAGTRNGVPTLGVTQFLYVLWRFHAVHCCSPVHPTLITTVPYCCGTVQTETCATVAQGTEPITLLLCDSVI